MDGDVVPRCIVGQYGQLRPVGMHEPATQDVVDVVVNRRVDREVTRLFNAIVVVDLDKDAAFLAKGFYTVGEGAAILDEARSK